MNVPFTNVPFTQCAELHAQARHEFDAQFAEGAEGHAQDSAGVSAAGASGGATRMPFSQLPSATQVAALFKRPAPQGISSQHPTVVLDRIQDVGNVGSILRSAAAFGFRQIIALKGTAALWGPKAVRAGMGAHFALDLHEDVEPSRLVELQGLPRLATSSHGGQALLKSGFKLPWPCAWFMGNEGQGLAADLEASCTLKVRIDQPGGQESLNVASAAAICLFASSLSR